MTLINKCVLSGGILIFLITFVGGAQAATSQPSIHVGDAAGGDLTGTYPNPTIGVGKVVGSKIADGAVTFSKIGASNANSASAGQVLTTDGAGGLSWANSIPFLEISGHIDATGDEPIPLVDSSFCNSPFVSPGSNQVRGRVTIGAADTSCFFFWADTATKYQQDPVFCIGSVQGGEPVPFSISGDSSKFRILRRDTTSTIPVAFDYICMGR